MAILIASLFLLEVISSVLGGLWLGRIVGGTDARDGAHPYQAGLRVYDRHVCGGSIITEKFILTAAQCLYQHTPKMMMVLVGTNSLRSGGDLYKTHAFMYHVKFHVESYWFDIGIVVLQNRISFKAKVAAIPLPTRDIHPGVALYLTGWGRTSFPGPEAENLQKLHVLTISNTQCQKSHPDYSIMQHQLCTLNHIGQGICHGDSGGPLTDGRSIIGIISTGKPCGLGFPDVFTRVYNYLGWIQMAMRYPERGCIIDPTEVEFSLRY